VKLRCPWPQRLARRERRLRSPKGHATTAAARH
jgi:hypothetical protein